MKIANGFQLQCETQGSVMTIEESLLLGSGGQADVYGVPGDSQFAVKLYHKTNLDLLNKLRIMIKNPPCPPTTGGAQASIAWPVDLVIASKTREPIGFMMPRVNRMRPLIEFYNPKSRRDKCPGFSFLYLHRTARNLATAMSALHAKGYVIGDVNESNILVSDTALVTLVDVDSFEVRDRQKNIIYRCPVGRPDISAPELLAELRSGKSFDAVTRRPEQDLFGLAVLIFQLLMEGTHPFAGTYNGEGDPPACPDRILAGHFPFSTREGIPYKPNILAPPMGDLHPQLQELFLQCFLNGHANPAMRPTALDWQHALDKSAKTLIECKKNPQHVYWEHVGHCPWCVRTKKLGGRDPFPFIDTPTIPTIGSDGQMGVVALPTKRIPVVAPPPKDEPLRLKLSKAPAPKVYRRKGMVDYLRDIPGVPAIEEAMRASSTGMHFINSWREYLLAMAVCGYFLCRLIFARGAIIYALAEVIQGSLWFYQEKGSPWSHKWQPILTALIGALFLAWEIKHLSFN